MTTPRQVISQRHARRRQLIDLARDHVAGLGTLLDVHAAVVVGSVAGGDFHDASDIDLILIADGLAAEPGPRWAQIAAPQGVISPVAWTPGEWEKERQRRNPLVVDALDHGVWLYGSPERFSRG